MGSTERPKKRTQLCKKAVVHFSLCFIMGFFTGFAPTGKSSISAAPSNRTEFVSPPITSQIAHRTFNLSRNLVAEPPPAAPREERKRKEEPKIKPRRQIIIVTPTRSRDRFREVGLRRLANTIRLVRQPLLWIVVEAKRDSSNLAEIMRKTGIMYRHLVFKENFTDSEAEMNHQRNVARHSLGRLLKNHAMEPSYLHQNSSSQSTAATCEENEERCKAHPVPISNSTGRASTAATQFVQTTTVTQFTRKSREEMAAIKIQSVFRGYLARSEIRTLRGLLRLKSLMESSVVDRQAMNTIRCMQAFVRVHSQIRSRRLRKLEENQALKKQLLQKHAKELEIFQVGKGWNDSTQSKEQVEAKLLSKHEAAMRRERALAYAFSQQRIWRNSSKSINQLFTDPNNPTWGWSWLERWMAAQQWGEASSGIVRGVINKADAQFELSSETISPTASRSEIHRYTFQLPSPTSRRRSVAEPKQLKPSSTRKSSIPDDYLEARFELSSEANSPTASRSESHRYTYQSLSTPSRRRSVAEPKKLKSSNTKKNSVPEIEGFGLTVEANSPAASRSESHRHTFPSLSTPSPRSSVTGATKPKQLATRKSSIPDDDCKSLASIQSNRSLRHSNGGPRSSVWDDESQTSSSILPSYMTFTESAKAKSKLHSPFETEKNGARERASFSSSAKKQLLYPPSPARSRRYSDRLKVDLAA